MITKTEGIDCYEGNHMRTLKERVYYYGGNHVITKTEGIDCYGGNHMIIKLKEYIITETT